MDPKPKNFEWSPRFIGATAWAFAGMAWWLFTLDRLNGVVPHIELPLPYCIGLAAALLVGSRGVARSLPLLRFADGLSLAFVCSIPVTLTLGRLLYGVGSRVRALSALEVGEQCLLLLLFPATGLVGVGLYRGSVARSRAVIVVMSSLVGALAIVSAAALTHRRESALVASRFLSIAWLILANIVATA